MDFSLRSILEMTRFSVQSPRAAARSLMAMSLPMSARWILFFFSVIASALASHIGFRLLPTDAQAFWADAMSLPIQSAIMQSAFWLLAVIILHKMGRFSAKSGSFADTLLLVGWWQVVFFALQAVQILTLLILPPVGELLGLVGLVVLLWLLTQFVMELHGFKHFWPMLLCVIGALFMAAITLIVILAMLVFAFTGGA